MKTMTILKLNNKLVAEYLENNEPEQAIVELFGTYLLPLPWSIDADLNLIKAKLAILNPNYKVIIK